MKVKLLSEFGTYTNKKSLLIELPQRLLDGIQVGDYNEIDTLSLLDVLKLAYDEESKALTLEEHINLMDAIFNPERAATEKPVNRKI